MSRKTNLVVVCLAVVTLTCGIARAAELYVSQTGNDAAAGDAAHPWKTLQHAANVVAPGDNVNVLPGNYTGAIIDSSHSGTATNRISFLAQPGVSITTAEKWGDGIDCEGASYITIDGFTANGMSRAGFRTVGNTGVIIRNCRADSCGTWGILTGSSNNVLIEDNILSRSVAQHGIYLSNYCTGAVIRDNIVWGNSGCGIHVNGDNTMGGDGIIRNALIEGNISYNNGSPGGGAGINMSGVVDSTIRNNLLYNNFAGGFTLYGAGSGSGPKNDYVENNTVVMASTGRWAANFTEAAGPIYFRNNILYQGGSPGSIEIDAATVPWLTSDYNIMTDKFSTNGGGSTMTISNWRTATGEDAHSTTINSSTVSALFVNMAGNDYHLAVGSAAINAGTSAGAPAYDLDGNPRPVGLGFDIGAFEYLMPGDANMDGKVSFSDYLALEQNFGKSGIWQQGDFNHDGKVSFSDYLLLEQNFGKSIPEPATLALLAMGGLGLIRRRRQ